MSRRKRVTRVLFVCLGNICRSTMAQFVMQDLVRRRGLATEFEIDSAGTSYWEDGRPVHRCTREKLRQEGVPCGDHRARRVKAGEYRDWDYIIGMDEENRSDLLDVFRGDPDGRVHLLLDWTDEPRDIADPWWTGDFDATYDDVLAGCEGLLSSLYGDW